ncbi:hypothetical protein J5N97_030116 [Dioscorea zingiberensis]|uniref:Uncharacterized protein n=1 Tax=Dioscorea zingiberensis TaxID=325984 RepID=A0A9D5BX22_9LILI|nr:hypothetical protein J5N97_030116 [Dioscorea zingiberensis]
MISRRLQSRPGVTLVDHVEKPDERQELVKNSSNRLVKDGNSAPVNGTHTEDHRELNSTLVLDRDPTSI